MASVRTRARNVSKPHTTARKPKVAAYARVSSVFESQENSFENQVEIYTERIKNNPAWEFAGVYADKAVTGTTDQRPEHQRMLSDCQAGKIDIILVKSISRFARNVIITVETVRKLKDMNVTIIFEKENIDTSQPYSEMLLTILAAFSQEESRSISERIKKGLYMRAMNGEIRWKPLYGYTRIGEDEYIIVEEEAEIVRWIFNEYLKKRRIADAAESLKKEKGIEMPANTIRDMLVNVKYVGDVITVKRYVTDHLTHSVTINRGEQEQVIIQDHHEGIVDRVTFNQVQELRQKRKKGGKYVQYPFGELPKCPYCGDTLHQRRCLFRDLDRIWICDTNENCGKYAVCSDDFEQAVVNAYNSSNQNAGEIKEAQRWWVEELIDSLSFEDQGRVSFVTVKWKNGESTKTEIPIKKRTANHILAQEKAFIERHRLVGCKKCR